MAKALKHWLVATGLASGTIRRGPIKNARLLETPLGRLVYDSDPHFVEIGTWWALHVNLTSARELFFQFAATSLGSNVVRYAHLANPVAQEKLASLCRREKLEAPLLVSPETIPKANLGQEIRRRKVNGRRERSRGAQGARSPGPPPRGD